MVTAAVRNTGGRALDVTGSLMLTEGPGGLSAGPFPAELHTTLAVGETEHVTITLDAHVPPGPWDAVVTLESGVTERRGEATITFPAAGEAATDADSGTPWSIVAGIIVAVLLVLGLAGLGHVRRARLRRFTTIPDSGHVPPAA